MTDELSPATRALLDNARAGMSPDAAAIARIRSKVDASIATGGSAATGGGMTLASKLSILGAVTIAAIAIGAFVTGRRDSAPDAAPPVARVVAVAPASTPPASTTPAPVAVQPAPEAAPIEMPTTIVEKHAPVAVKAAPSIAPVKSASVDLAREVELIDRAMAAMKRKDPAAALAAVRIHARETAGKGQLAEDAAAIEIEALCRSEVPIGEKLRAFDARWPSSAQRSRITTSCNL